MVDNKEEYIMKQFQEISTKELTSNPFQLIGQDWMLVTAEKEGQINTMTASWGGLGVMWNKDVAYIVLRPQRYTKEFVDASETFSLSFFDDSYKSQLTYLGRVSGRDEDKLSNVELTTAHLNTTPYFKEAKLVLICKKLFHQTFTPESFVDSELIKKNYPNEDYHTLYIAEITNVLTQMK